MSDWKIHAVGLLVALVLADGPVAIHDDYDTGETLTLIGNITRLEIVGSQIVLRLGLDGQSPYLWMVVLDEPAAMQSAGLAPEGFRLGVEITVIGHPHRLKEFEVLAECITTRRNTDPATAVCP